GEVRLAPLSGKVVLNCVRTPSNGEEVKVGGITLPTVTVVACAATAATRAQAVAKANARNPMRPVRRPFRLLLLRTSLRPVADMVLPSLYGSVFTRRLPRGTVRCHWNPGAKRKVRRGCREPTEKVSRSVGAARGRGPY